MGFPLPLTNSQCLRKKKKKVPDLYSLSMTLTGKGSIYLLMIYIQLLDLLYRNPDTDPIAVPIILMGENKTGREGRLLSQGHTRSYSARTEGQTSGCHHEERNRLGQLECLLPVLGTEHSISQHLVEKHCSALSF